MWEHGIVHLCILMFAYYNFGFIYGLLFIIAFIYVADLILDKMGFERVVVGDLFMSFEKPNKNHNIGGYFLIKKLKYENLQQEMYKRGILRIRKLRQIL